MVKTDLEIRFHVSRRKGLKPDERIRQTCARPLSSLGQPASSWGGLREKGPCPPKYGRCFCVSPQNPVNNLVKTSTGVIAPA